MPKATNNYTVRYSEKALSQYRKASAWYRERSLAAEDNFIAAVENRIRLIKENPYRYRTLRKHFFEISTKKYPFLIVYLIDENNRQVFIFAIHHHKQNPKRKYRK